MIEQAFGIEGRLRGKMGWNRPLDSDKKLEVGTFAWPKVPEGAAKIALRVEALEMLLRGIDLEGARLRPWYEDPTAAKAQAVRARESQPVTGNPLKKRPSQFDPADHCSSTTPLCPSRPAERRRVEAEGDCGRNRA